MSQTVNTSKAGKPALEEIDLSKLGTDANDELFLEIGGAGNIYALFALFRELLDTEPLEVLFSDNKGNPHVDLAAYVTAELIKSYRNASDVEMERLLRRDLDVMHAVGHVWMSRRTLSRMRTRNARHLEETGEDLVQTVIGDAKERLAGLMALEPTGTQTMDSTMVETFAKRLGRVELLYVTCSVSVREAAQRGLKVPGPLLHFLEDGDRNARIYHKGTEAWEAIADCEAALEAFGASADPEVAAAVETLGLVLEQQTIAEGGARRLRREGEFAPASELIQTPFDITARYRKKNNLEHVGHVLNLAEAILTYKGLRVRVTVDHELRPNTHSDAAFGAGFLEKVGEGSVPKADTLVCDGGYDGVRMDQMAGSLGVGLVRTNLTGRKPNLMDAEFRLKGDGTGVESCPEGHVPVRTSVGKGGRISASFERGVCGNCPRRAECRPVMTAKTRARKVITREGLRRAEEFRFRGTDSFKELSALRNGGESINGQLKRLGLNEIRGLKFERKVQRVDFMVAAIDLKRLYQVLGKAWRESQKKKKAA